MNPVYFQDLRTRVLGRTGDQALANEAAANAKYALDQIFHQTMVATGGDKVAADAAVARHASQVARLAELIPTIRGDDPSAGGAALREATRLLQGVGLKSPEALHGWLRRNVQNDETLQNAGFDPEAVRKLPLPDGLPTDREALLDLVRQNLLRAGVLDTEEVEGYLDVARKAMERLNIGEPTPEPAPEGETISVASLGIPRRV